MNEKNKMRRIVTLLAVIGLLVVGIFTATLVFTDSPVWAEVTGEFDDDAEDAAEGEDTPITGSALEQASQAALDYIGEGRVTATEVGDEEGYYEVEITREDGSEVDVHLDEAFNILSSEDE